MESPPIQRALLSVSDKSGLTEFAQGLAKAGVELYSTGGTRRALESAGIPVKDVAEYTGFPEMMDGRLKTLHPKIFGGILCRHDREDDMAAIGEHGIAAFELVVVNLYPFEATIARPDVSMADAIEQIDIGGPSLVRAAAKNHRFTTIATAASQYPAILEAITANGATTFVLRQELARDAFLMTARYDRAISLYFQEQLGEPTTTPEVLSVLLARDATLRYGENPHQPAAVYREVGGAENSLISAKKLNGKELSYNNLLDLDSALAIVQPLSKPAVSVIKHNNPCGAAAADTIAEACRKAMAGDPLSAFGSVLGVNRPVTAEMAEVLAEPGLFIEGIAAPSFEPAALEILTTKPKWKSNVRLLELGDLHRDAPRTFRQIDGGMLVQAPDASAADETEWKVVTTNHPDDALLADLRFGWEMVRHVKSNAIVLSREESLVGVGAGQMSRVDSVEISIKKAGDRAQGAVLASDAFFPFPDSIHRAAQAGIVAVIQPGGSKKDAEVIAACDELGLPMIFTGKRHFKH